jgi:hypothetical protein
METAPCDGFNGTRGRKQASEADKHQVSHQYGTRIAWQCQKIDSN